MKVVGLTGSIGMGKSTTAAMFAACGAPVYDADAAVHELYAAGGGAVETIGAAFPDAVVDGAIDRARLSQIVVGHPDRLKQLETIVHPLVAGHRQGFFATAVESGADLVILDVPLLFETGGDRAMDAVVVVSAPADLQRERVLARPGMAPAKLDAILARQLPDAEKRARADFVVDTSQGLEAARTQVETIVKTLRAPGWTSTRPKTDKA